MTLFQRIMAEKLTGPFAEEDVVTIIEDLRKYADEYAYCSHCKLYVCYQCLDYRSARMLAKALLGNFADPPKMNEMPPFICTPCYWSSKPCTNPKCPNEVGIPTKRCGGCHLDRYCSVDCQAAMYPDHVARCQRIQARRAAAGKV